MKLFVRPRPRSNNLGNNVVIHIDSAKIAWQSGKCEQRSLGITAGESNDSAKTAEKYVVMTSLLYMSKYRSISFCIVCIIFCLLLNQMVSEIELKVCIELRKL